MATFFSKTGRSQCGTSRAPQRLNLRTICSSATPSTACLLCTPRRITMREGDIYLHFRIVRYIDSGRFGDVFEAINTRQGNRRVALKIVRKRPSQNDEQEAESNGVELQKRLRSYDDRVVEIFESGKDAEGNLYIEMEYVEGKDLLGAIREGFLQ